MTFTAAWKPFIIMSLIAVIFRIAFLVELVMVIFIGSYHWSLGLLALCAFVSVGVILPLIIFKRSGNTGDEIRSQSGKLAAYVLENIRGLDETVQYGNGMQRMDGMNRKTHDRKQYSNRSAGCN